jgi:hypothetical protein
MDDYFFKTIVAEYTEGREEMSYLEMFHYSVWNLDPTSCARPDCGFEHLGFLF